MPIACKKRSLTVASRRSWLPSRMRCTRGHGYRLKFSELLVHVRKHHVNDVTREAHDVLGGGGTASLRNDAQGKGYAQLLLYQSISIPKSMADKL